MKNRARAKAWSQKNRVLLNVRAMMRRMRDPVAARAREQAKRDRRRLKIRATLALWRAKRRERRKVDKELDERLRRQNTEASRKRQATVPHKVRASRRAYYQRNREHIIAMQAPRTRRWRHKRKAAKLLEINKTAANALRRAEIAQGVAEQVQRRQRLVQIEGTQLAQDLAG